MIQLDQQALGAVEMVSQNDKHHALSCLRVGSHGDRRGLLPLPLASGNERHRKQESTGSCPAKRPPESDPTPLWLLVYRQGTANRLPDLLPVILTAHRGDDGLHAVEISVQISVVFGARGATFQVALAIGRTGGLAVVMLDELCFVQVLHVFIHRGASWRLNFCTARNTACFAELGAMFNTAAISSVERSSMCRRTKAVRSVGVSSLMAACCAASISRLSNRRSGPAFLSANCNSFRSGSFSSPIRFWGSGRRRFTMSRAQLEPMR